MGILPTVKVKREGGKGSHIINQSDYDPDIHELVEGEPVPVGTPKEGDEDIGAKVAAVLEIKNFMKFKSAAGELLDTVPEKKEDIVAALEALKAGE